MDRSGLGRGLAWSLAALAAGATVAVGIGARPTRPPDPVEDSTGVLLGPRSEIRIPPAPGGAWRVHPTVLSVTGVAGVPGGWLVLDARASRVHRLDGRLDIVTSFGGRGHGPGELSRPAAVTLSGDSLVAVVDAAGVRIDLFTPGGRFVDRLTVRVPGCPVGLSGGILPSPDGFVTYGVCGGPRGGRWAAAAVAGDGSARVLATQPLRREDGLVPPLGRGVLAWRGRIWIGSPDGCFSAVTGARTAGRAPDAPDPLDEAVRVCLPGGARVAMPDSLRRALAPRGGRPRGPEVALPDHWPPFLATAWSPGVPLLVLPPGPGDAEGGLALLNEDGSLTLVRTPDPVWPGPDGFLVTRTLLDGTAFRTESPG